MQSSINEIFDIQTKLVNSYIVIGKQMGLQYMVTQKVKTTTTTNSFGGELPLFKELHLPQDNTMSCKLNMCEI